MVGQEIGIRNILDHCSFWIKANDSNWGPKRFRVNSCQFDKKELNQFV